MTDKQQNRSEVHQEPISKDIAGMNSRGKDRRRFIKRAIVAAPFILTVTSRPVWAINCTMSGQLSGNLSDAAGEQCGGEGCSVAYWASHTDDWHYDFRDHLQFKYVFGTDVFGTDSLGDVISNPAQSPKAKLGHEAVAALQNSATRVSFEYIVCDLIYDVRTEFENGDNQSFGVLAGDLNKLNERICPFTL